MSAAEKRHMQKVADWAADAGCSVCGSTFAHLHHILEGRVPGRKPTGWLVVPLCLDCHTGTHGIHGDRLTWKLAKMSETQALEKTLEAVYGR